MKTAVDESINDNERAAFKDIVASYFNKSDFTSEGIATDFLNTMGLATKRTSFNHFMRDIAFNRADRNGDGLHHSDEALLFIAMM